MKCNQSRTGFELESPYPFPPTINITPQVPSLKSKPYEFGRLDKKNSYDGIISIVGDFLDQSDPSTATSIEEVHGPQGVPNTEKPHLVTFHEIMLVSLRTFQPTFVY